MKKILFMLCLLMPFTIAKALTINENNVITEKGVVITKEEYNKLLDNNSDFMIDHLDENIIRSILNSEPITEEYYIVTTYKLNKKGEIIESYETETTKEKANLVAENDNYYFNKNGKMMYNNGMLQSNDVHYSTDSKEFRLQYYKVSDEYTIFMHVKWLKIPLIKQFDILAARWDVSNSNISSIYGSQESDGKDPTFYDLSSKNVKRSSNGLGLSMNIHDNAKNYLVCNLYINSKQSFGNKVYGTYQHAKHSNANTLAISQSYTFSSDGLGGVLYFSNSKYRSYYDGMRGLICE